VSLMMDYANKIIKAAIAGGFDEAAARVFSCRLSYLKIANSIVDSIVTKVEESAELFVSSKKRVFFTNVDRLSNTNIANAINNAKEGISKLKPKNDYYGIAEGPFKYAGSKTYDKHIAEYDSGTLADTAYAAINAAISAGSDNVAGTIMMTEGRAQVATSKGVSEKERFADARLSLRAFRKGFSAQNVTTARHLKELKPEQLGRSTAELAGMTNNHSKIDDGIYEIVYMQQPAGALLSAVNDMACMGNVETGSFFTGRLGKEVANRNVKIYDDGITSNLVGTERFDDEGFPTKKTLLIGNGKLLTYLHNFSTATKYKVKSTGNAGLVLPSSNIFVMEHSRKAKSLDALVSKVEKGILITNTWYTRFSNYLTGDFSTVPRDIAIYIEQGEPRFAIKQIGVSSGVGIRISDNMIRMLKNVDCAAEDTIQTASWDASSCFLTPSVLVKGVRVTTA